MRWVTLVLVLTLWGCGGGGGSSPPVQPPEPPPPPVQPPEPPEPITCTHTISWTNPTHLTNGNPLPEGSLVHATLYAAAIPSEPQQYEWINEIDAYVLTWQIDGVTAGVWYYELTVSNEYGESDPASVEAGC